MFDQFPEMVQPSGDDDEAHLIESEVLQGDEDEDNDHDGDSFSLSAFFI